MAQSTSQKGRLAGKTLPPRSAGFFLYICKINTRNGACTHSQIITYDAEVGSISINEYATFSIQLGHKLFAEKSGKPLEKTQHLEKDVKPVNPFDKVVDNADFMQTYIKPSGPMSMSAVRAMLDARNRRKYRSQSV